MFVLSKSNLATAVDGVWIDNLVVRLFTLSFCLNAFSAKSESVGKKSRHKRGGAKDARIREHMAAHVVRIA